MSLWRKILNVELVGGFESALTNKLKKENYERYILPAL